MNLERFTPSLREEIEYLLDLHDPEEWKGVSDDSRLHDVLMHIEGNLGNSAEDKRWLRELRLWWIEKGVYREVTQEELDRTVILGRSRPTPDFRLDGKMYTFERHPKGFLDHVGD